ncbi:MAG: Glutamate-tRNA ligase [Candidatus Woesebacteria bacterium GW2011_GWB1_39_10]|uniref:Glutamate--tRNA ligase n=3 Tax=Candidatus Woeseibacteriota TaxID=1752722 RepID=A0A0G0PRJ9_9BACT|nr:MAG: Glutamate-tRNA ligase [Candidatus Woesebacteria bacterium GW2011_GWB1_39_10]KKS90956.1 MAG: Glutamate-tRNA ligase [Candidatus Woesebacteria bacterium GW2011_GWA1_43_12]
MVRTRFAPSPTGSMHIGNLRTAFYAYALAKHEKGDFILRIEDTDKKREVLGGVDDIKDLLGIFGIEWDEFYLQSERLSVYKKFAEKLVADGHAFYCRCEAKNAKEDGFSTSLRDVCRDKGLKSGAIKLRVPDNEEIKFTDFVLRDEIIWHSPVVFDATLLKSDGFPTYHLAVVVDDHEMKISHVLRGHDWLPSTPIHLLLYKYFGFEIPEIGHLTDILDPEGGKLSKRKGSTSVRGLLGEGYLPEALFNFVILSGWAPKDNRELFNLSEFVKAFDSDGFQKSNPVFNREKLDWFNGQYIRQMSDEDLNSKFQSQSPQFTKLDQSDQLSITKLIKDRVKKTSDINEFAKFFWEAPVVDKNLFSEKYTEHLEVAQDTILAIEQWNNETINEQLLKSVKDNGFKTGDFFMTLRIAITGQKFTPPINDSIIILGQEETLTRLQKAFSS